MNNEALGIAILITGGIAMVAFYKKESSSHKPLSTHLAHEPRWDLHLHLR